MRIALIGSGKMGKEIEKAALRRKHSIVLKIDEYNLHEFTVSSLQKADVAVEFSTPSSAAANVLKCFDASVPVVSGTTGWNDKLEDVKQRCKEKEGAFFYASNYSVGVNLFFKLNEYLAYLMKNFPAYNTSIEETHHIHKKDKPSGTALTLAQGIIKAYGGTAPPINSIRTGEVPGTHTITYKSPGDEIRITHEAYNRSGFADGAVSAAEWIIGKKGVFGMEDMMNEFYAG